MTHAARRRWTAALVGAVVVGLGWRLCGEAEVASPEPTAKGTTTGPLVRLGGDDRAGQEVRGVSVLLEPLVPQGRR